ncbi:hypothetical protein ABT034_03500 [Streptomyces sp. NPDC002773]|uniref:hypothetical protein n=1 Tax=Streptomyces sp. NPDC002773 TaxID=3154430 RepID=UPI0033330C07
MQSKRYTAGIIPRWTPEGIGSRVSSLESDLPELSAAWVLCERNDETHTWASFLTKAPQKDVFLWGAALRPQPEAAPPATNDRHTISSRTLERVRTDRFPMLPYFESTFERAKNSKETVGEFIENLSVRGTGFAFALGHEAADPGEWLQASSLMESHFSLYRDFNNSPTLESIRRGITSLYVRQSVALGFLPVIPLNKHPDAGFVLFCATDTRTEIVDWLTEACDVLEGDAALERVSRFLDLGGDLAYL